MALTEFRGDVLRAVVKAYICGQVEKHDRRFLPTSAEMAAEARTERDRQDHAAYRESERRMAALRAPERNPQLERPRLSEAEREAAIAGLAGPIREAVEGIRKAMDEHRTREAAE